MLVQFPSATHRDNVKTKSQNQNQKPVPKLNCRAPQARPKSKPKKPNPNKLFETLQSVFKSTCVRVCGVCVCCTRLFAASSDMKVFCYSPSFRTGHGCDYSWLWLCVVAPFSGTLKCPKSQRDVATRHRISSSVSVDSPDNAPGQVRNALTPTSHLIPARHPLPPCWLRPCDNMPHAQLIVLVLLVCVCVCRQNICIVYTL